MPTSVHEVFDAFRQAPSNYERGAKFEKLMTQYLPLDPVYSRLFERVWLWKDWPGRAGKTDTGIDLVAQEVDTADLWAIQCKFYEPDHTLSKPDIDSFLSASGKHPFAHRLIISTTDKWGKNVEDACENQQIPVQRIGLADIAEAPVDWSFAGPAESLNLDLAAAPKNEPRPHQCEAIDKVMAGFADHDRGKLIMACGTGKTFTALKISERTAETHGGTAKVLFLVPSISLLSQTLREWTSQCQLELRSFAVCSDTKVSRAVEDINPHDVPLPATTDPDTLVAQMQHRKRAKGLTVVFGTYQSIGVISAAQAAGLDDFDLIICDEAHRTTGVTLADADESTFVKVHDATFLAGAKRLYMTATPRLFAEETKTKATEHAAVLASMDDETLYGPTFHRLGFGDAVERGLLTDYKVLVLTVDEKYIAGPLQQQLADTNRELNLDDATKIVGCWNGLAKRTGMAADGAEFGTDTRPMQRAVAFLRDIKSSKKLADKFATVIGAYDQADERLLRCDVEHVDGTFNALERNHKLQWLKAPLPDNQCRILANARCLSEGVDVPGLDAVLFLNPRNSVVDVVQSVGRVMRRAEGKQYGYIILPVGVPTGMAPSQALAENKRFKVVWQVLQALRAHDDRFNATVNKLELNKNAAESILVGHVPNGDEDITTEPSDHTDGDTPPVEAAQMAGQLAMFTPEQWRDAVYAKIVDKVGTRTYWEDWAKDVADIAITQQTRIQALLDGANPTITTAFVRFVEALRANLNDSIDRDQAIEMLSQHLITKPVFDALFQDYDFAGHNPVSQVMQTMVATLHDQALESETARLEGFYESVRMRAAGIDNADGKQHIVIELYEKFFRRSFPKTAKALGIVYTPTQVVDFILQAANDALEAAFGTTLSQEEVHVLDPFTGTGTFIVRLIQSGLIRREDLARKYGSEFHANEIVLLAYYIAAINIEAAYHGVIGGEYEPFCGIVLTDTFQITEAGDTMDAEMFPQNNDRILRQQATPIRVIVGNPPWSARQSNVDDNNANFAYPTLDASIERTYAAKSTATNKNTMYDPYIRAIRWASDRIGDKGVVAYVTNGGWIEANTHDGTRLSLASEFSRLYVYNLRGNQRQAGEQSREEGGKVFGSGSRNTVAILIAVKDPSATGPCKIFYRDIGDYLTRDEKLSILAQSTLATVPWTPVAPNEQGDWIAHRDSTFGSYTPIGSKKAAPGALTIFTTYSQGLNSGRDVWVYNFSAPTVAANMAAMIAYYNSQVTEYAAESARTGAAPDIDEFATYEPGKISWTTNTKTDLVKGVNYKFNPDAIRVSAYRPFCKQHVYFDRTLLERTYQLRSVYPTSRLPNMGIWLSDRSAAAPFSALMTADLPNLTLGGAGNPGQYFPRWTYVLDSTTEQLTLDNPDGESKFRRIDNITDPILAQYQRTFDSSVDKDAIFFYLYGLLHSPHYRSQFATDLKKMLPRIPSVQDRQLFDTFSRAGRLLSDIHLGYEAADPYPLHEAITGTLDHDDRETLRVTKMRFRSKTDKTALIYNSHVTLSGIPDDAHRYRLGSRSALEWIIERYQTKTDKASGIVNDPNVWADEHHDPRYVLDLVKRIVTVSMATMAIVDDLPALTTPDRAGGRHPGDLTTNQPAG